MADVTLRPADLSDLSLVYDWQRLPETRRFARNPAAPTWPEHQAWMKSRLDDESSPFTIIEQNGRPVGVLRLDRRPEADTAEGAAYEIAIFVDPADHGKGIAKAALSRVYGDLGNAILLAAVHRDNKASHRLFSSAGFTRAQEDLYRLTVRGGKPEPAAAPEQTTDR